MAENTFPSSEAISGMIETLMSKPELLQGIASLLGTSDKEEAGEEKEVEEGESTESETEATRDTANLIPPIPPQLLSKLPAILSLLGGAESGKKSKKEADREALLCALKPYLTESKVQAIEKLIKLSRLGDLLSSL